MLDERSAAVLGHCASSNTAIVRRASYQGLLLDFMQYGSIDCILGKLAFTSRAHVAAWAVEQGSPAACGAE
jgi:hypothetical protein